MDAKLAMLLLLFGSIIGLYHLRADHLARVKRLPFRNWRKSGHTQDNV